MIIGWPSRHRFSRKIYASPLSSIWSRFFIQIQTYKMPTYINQHQRPTHRRPRYGRASDRLARSNMYHHMYLRCKNANSPWHGTADQPCKRSGVKVNHVVSPEVMQRRIRLAGGRSGQDVVKSVTIIHARSLFEAREREKCTKDVDKIVVM